MDLPEESGPGKAEGRTYSEFSGRGENVVQAGTTGDIHFHNSGRSPWRPQQLPADVRNFVDRRDDLARLDSICDPGGVLVIDGTAGVGKTALAVHWAQRSSERFPDGRLYANLRGYDPGPPVTPEQVLPGFLQELGVAQSDIPRGVDAMASRLRTEVADKRALFVLDNVATARQITPLLPGTSRCLVIVTTSSRLTLLEHGAARLTVRRLAEPDAVALLREVMADHRQGDEERDLVELAALCAHLPLALRIAAERAAIRPYMPLGELIGELRDEPPWNALATEDEEEAQAVHRAFAWSYRALPEDAARLFRILALHPGPQFGEPAVAALAGTTVRRAHRLLDTLVGRHMVEQTAHDRYQCHDLLRAYAGDQVTHEDSAEERQTARRRVLAWYLRTADAAQAYIEPHEVRIALDPPEGSESVPPPFAAYDEALAWYEAESTNLAAAVRMAAEERFDRIAWQLAAVLRAIYLNRNPVRQWLTVSQIGLGAARRDGDRRGEADIHESLGMANTQADDLDKAAEHYRTALTLRRELGDRLGEALALNGLGLVARRRPAWAEARSLFEEGINRLRALGETYWEHVVLANLGEARLELGEPTAAEPLVRQALAVLRRYGDVGLTCNALTVLAMIHLRLGAPEQALAEAQEAVGLAETQRNSTDEGYCLLVLGDAQRAVGRPGDALVSYQRSADLHRRLGDRTREAEALHRTGDAYEDLGRPEDAAHFHRTADRLTGHEG